MEQRMFDIEAGERLRDEGMAAAAEKRVTVLELAERLAHNIAYNNGTVTIDDVREWMDKYTTNAKDLGNAAGSIFKGKEFEFTGVWVKSRRVSNHARMVRQWRLKRSSSASDMGA